MVRQRDRRKVAQMVYALGLKMDFEMVETRDKQTVERRG